MSDYDPRTWPKEGQAQLSRILHAALTPAEAKTEHESDVSEQLARGSKDEAQAALDLKSKGWLAWCEWVRDEERKRKAGK